MRTRPEGLLLILMAVAVLGRALATLGTRLGDGRSSYLFFRALPRSRPK